MADLGTKDVNSTFHPPDNRSLADIIENLADVCQLKINESMFTGTENDKV